jgi:hypothetical protein
MSYELDRQKRQFDIRRFDYEGRCRDDHNRIRPVRNCGQARRGKRTTRLATRFLARHARAAHSCFLSDIQTRRLPHSRP